MSEPALKRQRGRLRLMGVIFALAFLSLGLRLIDMVGRQADAGERLTAGAGVGEPDPLRREIADRRGNLLASNIEIPSIYADPALMRDFDDAARKLATVFPDLDTEALVSRLERSDRFAWVKRHVPPSRLNAFLELGVLGVGYRMDRERIYPNQHFASHALGFVDPDSNGLTGIEYAMDETLDGAAPSDGAAAVEPLQLSLDRRVQHAVRSELGSAMSNFQAKGACGLVRDIQTGELVALVSLPDFNPNHGHNAEDNLRRNRCTGDVYELGSLFKVLTVAMALESGAVSLWDEFDATEPLRIGRYRVRDFHAKKRRLTVPEIVAHSSNIGAARIAFASGGKDYQQQWLEALGLTKMQEIELPERGTPILPPRWPDITTATVSYGHGIAVTPLQFLEAASAVVGDGRRVPSTLLKRDPADPIDAEHVVSAATARDLRWLLWLTVARGSGEKASSPTYLVGGKTGTADKPRRKRPGYHDRASISSFLGIFPIEAPRFAVLIMLDEPQGTPETFGYRTGGWTAAPVVGRVIERVGPLLGVAPSRAETQRAMEARLETFPAWDGYRQKTEEGFAAVRPSG